MTTCEQSSDKILDQLIVDWRITLDCNLNCGFCTVKNREKTKNVRDRANYLRVPEIISLSKTISKIGRTSFHRILIHFTGGEPFIRKDIIQESYILKSLGLQLAIDTNGTLLNNDMREILLNYYDGVIFSLDGLENTHDVIRGKGVFKTVINNIKKLSQARKRSNSKLKISVNTAVSNLISAKEVEKLIETLDLFAVDAIRFIPVLYNDNPPIEKSYQPNPMECQKILELVYDLKGRFPQIDISKDYIDRIVQILQFQRNENVIIPRIATCYSGKYSFMVDAFGVVWPCCMFTQNNLKTGIPWKKALEFLKNNQLNKEFEKMKRLSNQSCKTCIIPFLDAC